MSKQYDEYLKKHVENVCKAVDWMLGHLPAAREFNAQEIEYIRELACEHDESKYDFLEYAPYDRHFYYGDSNNEDEFNWAWLHHIHVNPHHWQHWVLLQDDDHKPLGLEMRRVYVWEMVADWWSFSWASGNLGEIFDWYAEHADIMVLHERTREYVERLLGEIRGALGES